MEEHAITIKSKLKKPLGFFVLCCFFVIKAEIVSHFNSAHAVETSGIGPVLDRFNLTLEAGYRTEAAGPFFYSETKDSEITRAIPPFFSCNRDPATDAQEENIFYPLLTHIRYGKEQRWQFFQLLSFSSGQEQEVDEKKRFTIFPFYFQQRSPDTNLNYTAYFPIYGHLKDRLFRDEIFFVMFPIYGETRKRDVVTENYLYPFGHIRHG